MTKEQLEKLITIIKKHIKKTRKEKLNKLNEKL